MLTQFFMLKSAAVRQHHCVHSCLDSFDLRHTRGCNAAACTSPLVSVVGWLFARGLKRGAADLSAWCSGSAWRSLSPSEQMAGHTAVSDPPHTPCRASDVCLCASHAWLCAFLFPRNIHTLDTPHYMVEATSPELHRLSFFWWVPDLQAKADNPTDCSTFAPPHVKSPGYIRFDYFTSIFFGPPHKLLHQLQQVQISPAQFRTASVWLHNKGAFILIDKLFLLLDCCF